MKGRDKVLCDTLQTGGKELQELLHSHKSWNSNFTCPSPPHHCAIRDSIHPSRHRRSAATRRGYIGSMLRATSIFNLCSSPAAWIYLARSLSYLTLFFYHWQGRDVKSWIVLNATPFHASYVLWEGHGKEGNCSVNHFWLECVFMFLIQVQEEENTYVYHTEGRRFLKQIFSYFTPHITNMFPLSGDDHRDLKISNS